MVKVRDLSGNGQGVDIDARLQQIDFSTGDKTVGNKIHYLRANGAGNIVMRPIGASSDVTFPAKDGEYIPVDPGTVVRQTGTTVTSLFATEGS